MTSIRSRSIFASVLLLTSLCLAAPARAGLCPTGSELEALVLVNQERQAAGLEPLLADVRLVEAARLHSTDMAVNGFVSHAGSDGSTFSQRILDAGYPTPRSENVAAGFDSAPAVVAAWMDSPGHRANILDPLARHAGVGYAFAAASDYGDYWTMDFGSAEGDPAFPAGCGGVADTVPPVVTMASPAGGTPLSESAGLLAIASDNVGVAGVVFLVDGVPAGGEDTAAPYALGLDTTLLVDGVHTIAARARDAAGNQATSAGVSVTVDNTGAGDTGDRPPTGPGSIDLVIEPAGFGFRTIRAISRTARIAQLSLSIDGQRRATVPGATLAFDWDVRPLFGAYEVRVDGLDEDGSNAVASSSLFYAVGSEEAPSVSLDVVDFPIIGATFIRGVADVPDVTALQIYVDGRLVASSGPADRIEHAWAPVAGVAYEILFVGYNATGVAASVAIVHVE